MSRIGRRRKKARSAREEGGDFAQCKECARAGSRCSIPAEGRASTCARLLNNIESTCTYCRRKRGGCRWVCFRFEERSKRPLRML